MIGEASARLEKEIASNHCPACDATEGFLSGPQGALNVNIKCAACGTKYNHCPGFFAQFIGHD